MPDDLTADDKLLFAKTVEYQNKEWLSWKNNSIDDFTSIFYAALYKNEVDDFGGVCLKSESAAQCIKDGKKIQLTGSSYDSFVQHLVEADKKRIDLSTYEESRLTGPNGGHWDLWRETAGKNETLIHLDNAFYGRNPVADVKLYGIVGIDFGTTSTVVTFQNGTDSISPMRIGCGDYKKDVAAADYENSTVMEFIDIDRFCSCYNSSGFRPETEWNDLTISHTAADNLSKLESGSKYYAWFSEHKQWAGYKNKKVIIKDKRNKEIELPPFADISVDNLNPIELYAYMLGLFINNMYSGIYINYILSFPVTYERGIRQQILNSFSKGLKKLCPSLSRITRKS